MRCSGFGRLQTLQKLAASPLVREVVGLTGWCFEPRLRGFLEQE